MGSVWSDCVEYSIFIQDLGIPEMELEVPPSLLAINTPINITGVSGDFYRFILSVPSVVAFNYTGVDPALSNIIHQPDVNTMNAISSQNMDQKSGNLFGDFLGQLYGGSSEWFWLPAGNITFQWNGDGNTTFMIFAIPVQSLTSIQNLVFTNSTIFAFELPTSDYTIYDLLFNYTAAFNESYQYEWGLYACGNEDP